MNIKTDFEEYKIEIYDMIGKKLFESKNQYVINIQELKKGMYILKISSSSTFESKVFIKK